jgi:hypothetical protein
MGLTAERGTEVERAQPSGGDHDSARARSRRRLERFGLGALAIALLAYAFAPFVLTALDAARHHRVFLGVAGVFPWDTLQYLAYVRDGHDGLIRNLFGLTGNAVFLHPIWSASGIAQGLTGVGPAAIMAFWRLASVAVLFAGALRLVGRYLPASPVRRTAGLALCLFGGFTPFALLGLNSGALRGAAVDIVPAAALWDNAPIAIAIGLMPFAIDGMERVIAGQATRRTALWTAVCSLLIGWLHPWQGMTLMIVWLGLLLWRLNDQSSAGSPITAIRRAWTSMGGKRGNVVAVLVATAAAPAYYAILDRIDYSWANFSQADAHQLTITLTVVEFCVAPLVLIGAIGAWRVRGDRRTRGVVMWALATLAVVALSPPEQFHAFDGIALPIGVLVVLAWPGGRRASVSGFAAVAGLAAVAATFAVFAANSLEYAQGPVVAVYSELKRSDVRAVQIAARFARGRPILAAGALGTAIPALTGQATWVGDPYWTPDYFKRALATGELFGGVLIHGLGRFVASTGTNTLVEPCGWEARLEHSLGPLGFRELRVGCARVFIRGATS